jgi:3-phenylpropionate/trans-cinnamate dioxygenase ferredoxin subunit
VEGNLVICPCHEVGFDLDSGRNMTSPGVCDDQPRGQVSVADGELYLESLEGA